jgi:hypothetical protein
MRTLSVSMCSAYYTRTLDSSWPSFWANLQDWRREIHVDGAGTPTSATLESCLDMVSELMVCRSRTDRL